MFLLPYRSQCWHPKSIARYHNQDINTDTAKTQNGSIVKTPTPALLEPQPFPSHPLPHSTLLHPVSTVISITEVLLSRLILSTLFFFFKTVLAILVPYLSISILEHLVSTALKTLAGILKWIVVNLYINLGENWDLYYTDFSNLWTGYVSAFT